jgi:hypothetical protein
MPVFVTEPVEIKKSFEITSPRMNPPFQVIEPEVDVMLSTCVAPVPSVIDTPSRAIILEVVPVPLFARVIAVFPDRGMVPIIDLLLRAFIIVSLVVEIIVPVLFEAKRISGILRLPVSMVSLN